MKNQFLVVPILFVALAFSSCTTERVVVERPAPPPAVVVKPAPPPHKTVFVEYEYRWRNGQYVLVPSHYIKAKPKKTWVPGHWNKKDQGYVWVQGHWK